MVLAQAFPFVALYLFEGGDKETFAKILVGTFILWLLLNIAFFCTIDLAYLGTFFSTLIGPQYCVERFQSIETDDFQKFDVVFGNIKHMKSVHGAVKEWVAANIDRWKEEKPSWFNIEMIPDDFLPVGVFEAEGGARRRRSSVSLRELITNTFYRPTALCLPNISVPDSIG